MNINSTDWDYWKLRPIHQGSKFIEDGAVNEDQWYKQNVKVLFLMKEAYDGADIKTSLSDYFNSSIQKKHFGKAATFPNLLRWADAIRTVHTGCSYNYNPNYTVSDILNIAVVNLKKSAGKKVSDDKDLSKYVNSDWDLIENQILQLNPDFIVCCGTFNLIREKVNFSKNEQDCRYNKLKWKKGSEPYLINFVHPAARISHSILSYSMASICRP